MKRYAILAVGFLTLAGVIGLIAQLPSGGGGGTASSPAFDEKAPTGPLPMASPAPAGEASHQVQAVPGTTGTTTTVVAGSGGGASTGASSVGSEAAPVPGGIAAITTPGSALSGSELVGPRIIETAQLSLVIQRRGFDRAFDRVGQIAGLYGGFVESSSSQGVRSKSGRFTIRVPARSFQPALHDIRTLGRVEGQSISGQDVTSEYVDLQARLRNWQAQERALLKLMSRATTIGETLRIQNELSQVQMRIEELKGQLRVLNDKTQFATIDVGMRERGAPVHPVPVDHHTSSLLQAWRDARHGFVSVLSAVVVGLGYLLPITALLALVWLGIRRLRPRVAA